MKLRLWIVTLLVCMAVWPLAACSRQEPAAKDQAIQRSAEQPPAAPQPATAASATAPDAQAATVAPDAQAATGELRNVDLGAKTLTIKDAAGNEQTFSFTDSTVVAGAAGSQGLANQQGNQVIVRYLEQDRHTAVRIEFVPR
jgi:hypothetical protein